MGAQAWMSTVPGPRATPSELMCIVTPVTSPPQLQTEANVPDALRCVSSAIGRRPVVFGGAGAVAAQSVGSPETKIHPASRPPYGATA